MRQRGCRRCDNEDSLQTGFNQQRNKPNRTAGLEPYIRAPPRVTKYDALLLRVRGCGSLLARDTQPFDMDRDESCFSPGALLSLTRQRGGGPMDGR